MVTAYIDESGNLGRAGKYFVLAAVVFDTGNGDKRIDRLIRKQKKIYAGVNNKQKMKEIKSSALSFTRRQEILNKMVERADVDIYCLVTYKPSVTLLNPKLMVPKNLVYNYFAKILTDMIFAKYSDDFRIVFDQRSTCVKSMNSLPEYIKISAYANHNHVGKQVEVLQRDSKTLNNLQAADVVAGTVYHAYRDGKRHFLDLIRSRMIKLDEFPRGNFVGSLAWS